MAIEFLDMVRNTLDMLPVDGRFSVVFPKHSWYVADELFADTANRMKKNGGNEHDIRIVYKAGESTKWVKPGALRNPTLAEYTVAGKIPLVTCYYEVVHLEKEIRDNITATGTPEQRAAQIIDVLKMRRQAEALGFFDEQEDKFWELPVLTGDNQTPHGLPYHIAPITGAQVTTGTTLDGAFQGVHGYGMSYWQNIDLSTQYADDSYQYSGLWNWNFQWDGASAADVTMSAENKARMATMHRHLHFRAPVLVEDLKTPAFSQLRMFSDEFIIKALGVAAQEQNDNLGANVTKYLVGGVDLGRSSGGSPLVNGLPVMWTEALDTASLLVRGAHPLYMVNLEHLYVVHEATNFMKKRPAKTDGVHQPDVIVEYVDSTFTYACSDRQKVGGVGSYVTGT